MYRVQGCDTQLTFEQHKFEMPGSNISRFFSINTFSVINVFSLPYDFLNDIFSIAYFITRVQYIVPRTCKLYVN